MDFKLFAVCFSDSRIAKKSDAITRVCFVAAKTDDSAFGTALHLGTDTKDRKASQYLRYVKTDVLCNLENASDMDLEDSKEIISKYMSGYTDVEFIRPYGREDFLRDCRNSK